MEKPCCLMSAMMRILPALVWTQPDKTEKQLREGLTPAGWGGGGDRPSHWSPGMSLMKGFPNLDKPRVPRWGPAFPSSLSFGVAADSSDYYGQDTFIPHTWAFTTQRGQSQPAWLEPTM